MSNITQGEYTPLIDILAREVIHRHFRAFYLWRQGSRISKKSADFYATGQKVVPTKSFVFYDAFNSK